MGKYFTVEELCLSDVATERGIDNTPATSDVRNMEFLIKNLLDPLREAYGSPINVTSGFRSKALNASVGGAKNSQHTKGEAADLDTFSFEGNKRLFHLVQELDLPFDQLIDEKNYSWIHVSLTNGYNRKQILHL